MWDRSRAIAGRPGGERGSITVALLLIIVLGGLSAVLLSRSVAEQRSTRFDNEYQTAVHAAETGLNEAVFRLNNHLVVGGTDAGSGEADGYSYDWESVRDGDDGSWEVTASSVGPTGVRRTVVADVRDEPIFDISLATHLGINFQGGNRAASYNSRTQQRCSPPTSTACFGIVASNGPIDMGSTGPQNNYADRVRVHDWGNPENQQDRCIPTGSVYCQPPHRENIHEPLNILGQVDFVNELLETCNGNFVDWRASTARQQQGGPTAVLNIPPVAEIEDGKVVCVGDLWFDEHTILPASATADDGLIVVVRDRIKIEGSVRVNCPGCAQSPVNPLPAARRLQIFTLAQDQQSQNNNVLAAVQVRQHARIGSAIYAPNASCGNHQSNAQVHIYGSLICRSVLNQGGWEFHYDEDLLDGLTTEAYEIARWREEPSG